MTGRAISVTSVGLLAGALALAAQTPQSTPPPPALQAPTFRATTHLVRVDASVTDAEGRPVSGLTAADFTLLDRGRPQAISAFEEIHHEPSTTSVVGHRDVASNLVDNKSELMVLVLDDERIRKEWSANAREIVGDFVRDLDEDTLIAMVSTSGKYNVELTNDRQRILDALATFSGQEVRQAYKAPGGQEGLPPPVSPGLSPEMVKKYHLEGTPAAGGTGPPPPVSSAGGGTCGGAKGRLEGGDPYDSDELYGLLGSAAKILGSDEARHKGLGWISTGEALGASGLAQAIGHMKDAGVATYAIDPVGSGHVVAGGANASGGCSHFTAGGAWLAVVDDRTPWQAAADNRRTSLTATAKGSGGEAIVEEDDFNAGVQRLASDFGAYYTLGFYPDDTTTPGARPLAVSVNRDGLTVRARLTYTLTDVADMPVGKALPTLVSGLAPTSDLPLRLYAATLPPTSGHDGRVVLTLEVTAPAAALAEGTGELRDALTYGVFAVSLHTGKVAQSTAKTAELSLRPSEGGGAPDVTYSVETSLQLPSGHYQIRASAMSAKLGAGGSVYALLDMPDYAKSVLALSDVIIGDSTVRLARTSDPRSAGTLSALTFAPTLNRTFRAGDPLHLFAQISSRLPAAPVTVDVAFVAADGRVAWHEAHTLGAADRGQLDVRLPVPPVTPGSYALRVSADDGPNHVSRDIAILIR